MGIIHSIPPLIRFRGAELQKVGETGEISLGVSDLWNAILIRAAEIMPFYSGSGTNLTGSQYSHSVYKLQCIIMHDNYIYWNYSKFNCNKRHLYCQSGNKMALQKELQLHCSKMSLSYLQNTDLINVQGNNMAHIGLSPNCRR